MVLLGLKKIPLLVEFELKTFTVVKCQPTVQSTAPYKPLCCTEEYETNPLTSRVIFFLIFEKLEKSF